jgi:hypothetical protein
VVKNREVLRVHEVVNPEVFLGFFHARRQQSRRASLFVDDVVPLVVVVFFF